MDFEARIFADVVAVSALALAQGRGVLRHLHQGPQAAAALDLPPGGREVLLHILRGVGAVEQVADGRWSLTAPMRAVLDAGEATFAARLQFVRLAMGDMVMAIEALAEGSEPFQQQARTFDFFRYDRAMETRAPHLQDTAPWVAYVTALTVAEAPVLAPLIPVGPARHLLEIGGNSGEFALSLLVRHPALTVTVVDLPAVCHLGAQNVAGRPGADRLRFLPGDARRLALPQADIVLFKSVLHDWELPAATAMIRHSAGALTSEGQLVICERGALADEAAHPVGAENLVFAHHYRAPTAYDPALTAAGLAVQTRTEAQLDMRFHITTAASMT
jgi:hypothetical protein